MPFKSFRGGYLQPFTEEQVTQVCEAAFEVLERVGIAAESDAILKIFGDSGADVDFEKGSVKIPRHLAEECLEKAPKKITLCGRDPENDVILEGKDVFFGMGGSPKSRIIDLYSGMARVPTKKDLEDSTRLGDALPGIAFIQNLGMAADKPQKAHFVHAAHAMMKNTRKHMICTAPSAEETRIVIEMASAVDEDLVKRPFISIYSNPLSPLTFTQFQDNIIVAAEHGLPIVLCHAPMAGATAPVTLAGSVVQNIAENMSSVVLCQLVRPGNSIVPGATSTICDMRTSMFSIGGPEFIIEQILSTQAMHHLGFPYFGGGGCSDAKTADAQAGAEAAMTALTSALVGMNMIQDVGVITMDDAGSMELTVIADELIGIIGRILDWAQIDEESLAVDVISQVGPKGHFLANKHTLKHFQREHYMLKLFDRYSEEAWMRAGAKDIATVARERARKILEEHHPQTLSHETEAKLEEIVKEAEKKLA